MTRCRCTTRLQYLVLPVVTLSLIPMGVLGRLVRATVLEILGQDFVGALAAKGLTRWPVIRHICKNAAPPVLALMGLQFGYLLGGSILVETVFNWPGSGNLLNLAIFRRDIPVLQATILVLATFFVVLNLLVDIAQAAIDPRHAALNQEARMSHTTLDEFATRASPVAAELPATPAPGYWKSVGQRLLRDPVTIAVTLVLLAILFITLGAPLVTHYDPDTGSVLTRLKPIGTPGHWLGTDETGRDLWTRLCYGGRLSLLAAVLPVTISLIVGGFLGFSPGYAGGLVGTLIMRTMDVFYAFPSILLAIAICGMLGNGLTNSILALAVVFIPPMVRVSKPSRPRCGSLISWRRRALRAARHCKSSAITCWPTCWDRSWSMPPA